MSNEVFSLADWNDIPDKMPDVPEGDHTVQIKNRPSIDEGKLKVMYSIIDEGEFKNAPIFDNFNLSNPRDRIRLKKMAIASGVTGAPADVEELAASLEQKILKVKAKHSKSKQPDDDGNYRTFVNAVDYKTA